MIVASTISRDTALRSVAQSLGLPETAASLDASSSALIAQSLRRSVFIAAPCNVRTARTIVASALALLTDQTDEFNVRVGEVLDDLIATGDLLEMRTENMDIILRPAPPAFVMRDDGTFIVLGVGGDEITPNIERPVSYRTSGIRTLSPDDTTACRATLLEMGFLELPRNLWLHAPAASDASVFLDHWLAQLPQTNHPEKIEDLEVLDTSTSTKFHKGRWRPLRDKDSGLFLARRPQKYGSKLWSLIEVQGGLVQKMVDVHSKDARIRDCDEAWRIQAAFDARACAPQVVGVTTNNDRATLSFYSPIPAWAIRRLSLIGERVKLQGALFSFELHKQNLDDEIRWLKEKLWLAHVNVEERM